MNGAKIRLSPTETELVQNAGIILTKNEILRKVGWLLGEVAALQQLYLQQELRPLPAGVLQSTPKISRGENYRGLPYQVLDYPRIFDKENILAVRSLFWWGHFFSVTLQLSGHYKSAIEQSLIRAYAQWVKHDFYCCVQDDPWEHHFEETNYRAVNTMTEAAFAALVEEKPFIKLAVKIPLLPWEEVPPRMLDAFRRLTDLLTD